MDFVDLNKKRRSVRHFKQETLKREELLDLVDAASFAHSIGNRQSLRYLIVTEKSKVNDIFENSSLGLVNQGEAGLVESDFSPGSYILTLGQRSPSHVDFADAGASFQNMALVGMEMNIGLFWIHAFAAEILQKTLEIPSEQTIINVIAVGRPAEIPVVVSITPGEEEQYYDSAEKFQKISKLRGQYLVSWRE
jgi:nitroreductase